MLSKIFTRFRQHKFKTVSILLTILIGGWLLFATILAAFSSKLIFKSAQSHGVILEVPHEQLWLKDSKKRKIDTVWIENPTAKQVVLYLHGNIGRLSHFFAPLSQNYSVLAPAYPGYHGSTGSPNTANVYSTALLAYDYLIQQGYTPDQIIVFGHSLGGSPATYLAAQRRNVGKLVLVNTFNSMYDMCWYRYKIGCFFAKDILNTGKYAKLVTGKVRQYHDLNDLVVPFSQGEKLFKNFINTQNKKFFILKNSSHSEYDVLYVISNE